MDTREIGKRIREKRVGKSWSQEELAERMDLTATYIGMIERGEKTPKLETFIRLADVLEVTADELLMDVVKRGYKLRMSRYAERVSRLDEREKQRLYGILDVFLEK